MVSRYVDHLTECVRHRRHVRQYDENYNVLRHNYRLKKTICDVAFLL